MCGNVPAPVPSVTAAGEREVPRGSPSGELCGDTGGRSGCENDDVSTRTWGWVAAVVDVLLIVLFALIGRSSHGEANTALALWTTAYPFLAGWAIGYVTSGAWARPLRLWPTGVVVWVLAVFIGLAIRVATGQGDVGGDPLPISFVIVTTIVLGVFLIGWRFLARLLQRAAEKRRDGHDRRAQA